MATQSLAGREKDHLNGLWLVFLVVFFGLGLGYRIWFDFGKWKLNWNIIMFVFKCKFITVSLEVAQTHDLLIRVNWQILGALIEMLNCIIESAVFLIQYILRPKRLVSDYRLMTQV